MIGCCDITNQSIIFDMFLSVLLLGCFIHVLLVKLNAFLGRIIPQSPAARCGELSVDDKLLSVNDNDVSNMTHSEIVSMVKNSGLQVKLVIDRSGQNQNESMDAPPRPVIPKSYTQSYISYNKQGDALREEYQRQRQVLLEIHFLNKFSEFTVMCSC